MIQSKEVYDALLYEARIANYTSKEIENINKQYEDILINFYLNREILEKLNTIRIKDEDIKNIYEKNKDKYIMEIRVKLDTIFLKDEKKANEILKNLNTKNFEKYKKINDEKESEEILDNKIPISMLHPKIASLLYFYNKKGIIKKLVKIDDGYHIVYLKEKDEERLATYEEARNLIIENIKKEIYFNIKNEIIDSLTKKYITSKN